VARELGLDPGELVKLSSNENPLGPSPRAVEAIRESAAGVHEYPKTAHVDLQAAVADRWDVAPEQVWLANGGDGAIDYLSRATLEPGDGVLVSDPGFAYYAMSARYHHGEPATYDLRKADGFALEADAVLDAYRLLAEETAEETLLVVDEAYGEFSDRPSAVELLGERDDVALLRTFSKVYGLAGMRVGYALVPEDWADAYARVNTPFAASEPACRAGLAALEDDEHVERSVHVARWAREFMRDALSAPTWESGGNFVLVDVGDADADDADAPGAAEPVARPLRERGVIVRDCTSFGLPGCVRVTCGTENETRRAVVAINEVVGG
jgi:histidinol-phosphate aminotransferase